MLTDNKFAKQMNIWQKAYRQKQTRDIIVKQCQAKSFKSTNPINNVAVAHRSNQEKPRDTL